MNLNHTTLRRSLSRREKIDDPLQNETWAFGGRLPRFDKKLSDDVKEEITQFWHSNSRVSPNAKDVLTLVTLLFQPRRPSIVRGHPVPRSPQGSLSAF